MFKSGRGMKANLSITKAGSGNAAEGVAAGDNAESSVEGPGPDKSTQFELVKTLQGLVFKINPALTAPAPNIKFIGRKVWDKGKRKVLKDPRPVTRFNDGGNVVELPPSDEQISKRLFYHEKAGVIRRHFPHLYKKVVRK